MIIRELADRLGCRLEGDGELDIVRVAGIEHAGPGDLSFIANPKYAGRLSTTRATAVIVGNDVIVEAGGPALLRCAHPYLAFAEALDLLAVEESQAPGIAPSAVVAESARLGADVSIGALAVVGEGAVIGSRTVVHPGAIIGPGAEIGEDCVLHARVSIRERVRLGHRVVVQDGAVIGSDGFGFVKLRDGTHRKIPQHADVVIEDDVEIGANTTIDRPAVGETRVQAGTKIDNLVQIAHGTRIGRRVLFAAQVGIAGSTVVEDDVTLAGQVGVAGHITIGKGVVATAQTGIPNSVEPGTMVSGYPAIPNRDWLKASAVFRHLPALRKRVAELEQRIAELEEKIETCRSDSGE
ncbi:MAG: UDP-3-O-(3-hydroxymyristoyl)glucosamine N-acyltransferase [Vicinamibacterales bacterium]